MCDAVCCCISLDAAPSPIDLPEGEVLADGLDYVRVVGCQVCQLSKAKLLIIHRYGFPMLPDPDAECV